MNLTKLAIRRPVSMFIVVLALVVFGFSAMLGAPLELMPDMEMPAMIILTIYPGAGPEEVNDLVTSVIEDSPGEPQRRQERHLAVQGEHVARHARDGLRRQHGRGAHGSAGEARHV